MSRELCRRAIAVVSPDAPRVLFALDVSRPSLSKSDQVEPAQMRRVGVSERRGKVWQGRDILPGHITFCTSVEFLEGFVRAVGFGGNARVGTGGHGLGVGVV